MNQVLHYLGAAVALVGVGLLARWLYLNLRFARPRPRSVVSHDAVTPQVDAHTSSEHSGQSLAKRISRLGFGITAIVTILLGRLWFMQLVKSEDYIESAQKNRTRVIAKRPQRGRILDRNNVEIVGNRPVLTVLAEKDALDDPLLIARLACVLGMPRNAVRRHIQNQSEGASAPRVVASDVSMNTVAYIAEHPAQFPHVSVEARSVRKYPFGGVGAHLLGYPGTISQEELKNMEQDNTSEVSYQSGDIVGKVGLELQYEHLLQGVRGSTTVAVDSNGRVTSTISQTPPSNGNDLRLTIDIDLQKSLEESLDNAIAYARSLQHKDVRCGAALAMNPKTGEVLALASRPAYNPASFVGGISSSLWDSLTSEHSDYPMNNRAIEGLYPAASTIKAFSSMIGLTDKMVDANTIFVCNGWWTGFGEKWGKWCWKHDGHGPQNVVQAIAHSCDVYFYELAKAYFTSDNPEGLQKGFRHWGLGTRTGIDLPSEKDGRIPDAAWKEHYFQNASPEDRKWSGGDTANIVIGQGDLLVTPLQILAGYCGIANKGVIMKPHILKEVISKDGAQNIVKVDPKVWIDTQSSPEHLATVQQGLHDMTNAPMSTTDELLHFPVPLCGKTGTGEIKGKTEIGWFVVFGPKDDPEIATLFVIEESGGGSKGPIQGACQFLQYYFDNKSAQMRSEQ